MAKVLMHPYQFLGEKFFWATAIAKRNMFDIAEIWDPRFRIGKKTRVVTFGSCFSQHIGRALRLAGFNWLVTEKAPRGLNEENARKFNYGIFSARTGNIYTVSLLKQWLNWSECPSSIPAEVWEKDGRFFDPFRPNIEPDGFASAEEVLRSRSAAVDAFRNALTEAQVFIFTLGLTESWFDIQSGFEYPMCPGTVAGDFNRDKHILINQDSRFVRQTLEETIARVRQLNPKLKFLLTVSPVPVTATMSGDHVLVASSQAKSVLRAVAGELAREFSFVDYFPSYELINASPFRGIFLKPINVA